MPLPEVCCPNCRVRMSLDVLLTDDSVRDALLAVIDVHPQGDAFIKPLLRYVGLFAPAKSQMSHGRIASLIREITPEIRDAQVRYDGTAYPAPLDYWMRAFDTAVEQSHIGRLATPLTSHGWLRAVIAGYARKADSQVETTRERQRAGHAGYGTAPERQAPVTAQPLLAPEPVARVPLPDAVRQAVGLKPRTARE